MRRVSTVLAVFALTAAPAIKAQEAGDTLPFRAHQWGFLFTGGSSFSGVGALHFTAPNRAWVFDVGLTALHQHLSQTPAPDTTYTSTGNEIGLNARIGRRFYQPAGHGLASFQTIGLLLGVQRGCSTNSPVILGSTACTGGGSVGLFGELGAQYFLTPRFSIGGQVTASLSAQYQHTSYIGTSDLWAFQLSAGSVSFGGGVYF